MWNHISWAVAEWGVGNRQRLALIMHGSNMPNYPILSSPLRCKRLLLRVVIIHGEHPASPLLLSHPLLSIFLPEKNVSLMKWNGLVKELLKWLGTPAVDHPCPLPSSISGQVWSLSGLTLCPDCLGGQWWKWMEASQSGLLCVTLLFPGQGCAVPGTVLNCLGALLYSSCPSPGGPSPSCSCVGGRQLPHSG